MRGGTGLKSVDGIASNAIGADHGPRRLSMAVRTPGCYQSETLYETSITLDLSG